MPRLFVAPITRKRALYAVRAYHYTGTLPAGRCQFWGVWFCGEFFGVVVVSRGSCQHIGRPFQLAQDRIAEVSRIAVRPGHEFHISEVLAVVARLLKRSSRLELLISYADSRMGHDGRGVYGGANWIYLGPTHKEATLLLFGKEVHARTVSSTFKTRSLRWLQANVDPNAQRIINPVKHKWALALTPTMRERLAQMAQPYPKREQSAESGTPRSRRGSPSLDGAQRRGLCDETCSLIPVSEPRHG